MDLIILSKIKNLYNYLYNSKKNWKLKPELIEYIKEMDNNNKKLLMKMLNKLILNLNLLNYKEEPINKIIPTMLL